MLLCYVIIIYFIIEVFFLMIRRPPGSTQSRSSAASNVYKRQGVCKASADIFMGFTIVPNGCVYIVF